MKLPGWLVHPYTHAAALFLSLLAAVVVVAFIVGTLEYTKMRGRLLLSALMVAGYFLTTLAATGTPKDGAMRWLYAAMLGFATIALLLLLAGLWITPNADDFWRAAGGVTLLALGMSLAGLTLGLGSTLPRARIPAWALAALASILTAMTIAGIAFGIGAAAYWWAFSLLALLWLTGSAVLSIVWARYGRNADP